MLSHIIFLRRNFFFSSKKNWTFRKGLMWVRFNRFSANDMNVLSLFGSNYTKKIACKYCIFSSIQNQSNWTRHLRIHWRLRSMELDDEWTFSVPTNWANSSWTFARQSMRNRAMRVIVNEFMGSSHYSVWIYSCEIFVNLHQSPLVIIGLSKVRYALVIVTLCLPIHFVHWHWFQSIYLTMYLCELRESKTSQCKSLDKKNGFRNIAHTQKLD